MDSGGSQGRIPGPRARLCREGLGKSQRGMDLRPRGAAGEQRARARGSRPVGATQPEPSESGSVLSLTIERGIGVAGTASHPAPLFPAKGR